MPTRRFLGTLPYVIIEKEKNCIYSNIMNQESWQTQYWPSWVTPQRKITGDWEGMGPYSGWHVERLLMAAHMFRMCALEPAALLVVQPLGVAVGPREWGVHQLQTSSTSGLGLLLSGWQPHDIGSHKRPP